MPAYAFHSADEDSYRGFLLEINGGICFFPAVDSRRAPLSLGVAPVLIRQAEPRVAEMMPIRSLCPLGGKGLPRSAVPVRRGESPVMIRTAAGTNFRFSGN